MWVSFLKLIIIFPLIIILLLFSLKLMQKYSSPVASKRHMKLIEQLRLSPKTNLSIIKVSGEYLVIAHNDEHIELISKLSEEDMQLDEENKNSMELNFFKIKKGDGWWKNE